MLSTGTCDGLGPASRTGKRGIANESGRREYASAFVHVPRDCSLHEEADESTHKRWNGSAKAQLKHCALGTEEFALPPARVRE